jgi:hypothetical protein
MSSKNACVSALMFQIGPWPCRSLFPLALAFDDARIARREIAAAANFELVPLEGARPIGNPSPDGVDVGFACPTASVLNG